MVDASIWRGGDDLLRCTAISEEAPGVKTFRFVAESGARIRFHAGQFVTLRLPLPTGEVWRCFTIASSPLQDEAIDLSIKAQPSATINTSGTTWMHQALEAGTSLKAMPPAGPFCLMQQPETPLLLVSAGSGATPMASIARWLRDIGCRTPVHYVHLARTPADWLFKPEIEAIAAELGSWKLHWLTTSMNGRPTACGVPSTVTRPSSMTSSSADWVFGEARLISSASTIVAKIGPLWKVNWLLRWSKIVTPVTSLGSRSGVNCTRLFVPWMELAIALASEVFPVPGKSSSSRCPSETRQVSASRTMWFLPSTACSTFVTSAPKALANQLACSDVTFGTPAVAVVMILPIPSCDFVPFRASSCRARRQVL